VASNRIKTFQPGEGLIISFRVEKGWSFEMFFVDRLGDWDTPSYKRFGIAGGSRGGTEISNFVGVNNVGPNIRSPKPEIWLNLLLAIGKDQKFLLLMWEPDTTSKEYMYSKKYPQWGDAEWQMRINSFGGQVEFDNYSEISFSEMK
jgi:hypothetical protein